MANNYILAMYDIRAKQDFIFNTNHIKEIVGGSAIIRDCFNDYLYPAAKKLFGLGIYHKNTDYTESDYTESDFTESDFCKHIEEGYIGELVYEGGGNVILIYKDVDTYRRVTYEFTKTVLKKIGTLRVLSSYVEGVNFADYKGDNKRLRDRHIVNEGQESNIAPWGTLPIVQVDYRTSKPLTAIRQGGIGKVTKESNAKYAKFGKEEKDPLSDKFLENLETKKGQDSLIAIVYIDGNSMGKQVEECIHDTRTYEEAVKALRSFSADIRKKYIRDRLVDLHEHLSSEANKDKWRLILGAGDEINFVCNAHDALPLALTYLKGLPNGCSACAGIAVFRSHAPYSDAYRIAEECCESGKQLMKKIKMEHGCFVDFHYCQGAIDISLEQIRKNEGTEDVSRPWYIPTQYFKLDKEYEDIVSIDDVSKMKNFLNLLGRSNVKGLADHAKNSMASLQMDLKRIYAHMSDQDRKAIKAYIDIDHISEKERKLIYDMVISYDLWFQTKEEV